MFNFTKSQISTYFTARIPALRQHGREWRGPCPIHKGVRDSFAVEAETGRAFCHSKCGRGWGLIELEQALTGANPAEAKAQVNAIVGNLSPGAERRRIVATYSYTDESGRLLFEVVRYAPKDFRQRKPQPSGRWAWTVAGVRSVPFRLPNILNAETVIVVEGEKDVLTLESWGFAATCNSGGAKKWNRQHAACLKGKHVVIIPDNDADGDKHAEIVDASLRGVAATVCLLRLPDLPPKGDVSDWKERGGTAEQLRGLMEAAALKNPHSRDQPACCPHDSFTFRVDDAGVFVIDPSGRDKDRWISPRLDVLAQTRDFNGDGWGVQVRFRNSEGNERTTLLSRSALVGEGKEPLERLLDMGFKPRRDRASLERVKDYIYQASPNRYIRCVSRVGWHGGIFVLPDRSIGPTSSEEVVFYSEAAIEHKYRQAGSLEEWRSNVGRLCAGNSRLLFAVSCAFAAPLLDLLKSESAGFHFRGLSSTGKTTALLVGGSVWGGNSQTGFLETWRATANGLEARAALHNHGLLCLDEIGEVRDSELGEIIYALGNGGGKSRMTRTLSSRAGAQFKLLFLSTGERTLSEVMQSAGRSAKGGQEARLIEVPADAGAGLGIFENLHEYPSPDQLSRALAHSAKSAYGTPITAFLELVAGRRDEIACELRRSREQFVNRNVPSKSAGEIFRVASSFGLIAAGGELAARLGITGWLPGEAAAGTETCFLAWIGQRGGIGASDIESGIRAVRAFLQVHGPSRFQEPSNRDARIPNRAGYRERDDDLQWCYYILPEVFEDEVCRGRDYRAIAKELARRGWLRIQAGQHLTIRKRIEGEGNVRVFAILPAIYSDDQYEEDRRQLGTLGTVGTEELTI